LADPPTHQGNHCFNFSNAPMVGVSPQVFNTEVMIRRGAGTAGKKCAPSRDQKG